MLSSPYQAYVKPAGGDRSGDGRGVTAPEARAGFALFGDDVKKPFAVWRVLQNSVVGGSAPLGFAAIGTAGD